MATSSEPDSAESHQFDIIPMSRPSPSFLILPAEIRLIIYRYFFANLTIFFHRRKNCKNKVKPRSCSPLNLFLTNRQLRGEVLPIYFSDCLFTFERNICMCGMRNTDTNPHFDRARHRSPHFHMLQRVECSDQDAHHVIMRARGPIREVTLLVEWNRWMHLIGYPDGSSGSLWTWLSDAESYPRCLLDWLRSTPKTVILQRDRGFQPTFSIWRDDKDDPLPVLPDQKYQRIIFENGRGVVAWGIEADRQRACEVTIRSLFKVPAHQAVRFEGTPVNGVRKN